MNKRDAKEIAETITKDQLVEMFRSAKNIISNWEDISIINKSLSKGAVWNIFTKAFDASTGSLSILVKTNMIREFGEYLPNHHKPKRKSVIRQNIAAMHQEPVFSGLFK